MSLNWLKSCFVRLVSSLMREFVLYIINNEIRVYGIKSRIHISPHAHMVNTLFNTSSGDIYIGEYTFTGHNVSLITGHHDLNCLLDNRQRSCPVQGRDIIVGKGVWIGSNSTIIGPCRIGDHAIIAAGAVVTKDVPEGAVVAGVPARIIKKIPLPSTHGAT